MWFYVAHRRIQSALQPVLDSAQLSSMLNTSHSNDALMELLLSYIKSHSLHSFSSHFLRQLLLIMVDTQVLPRSLSDPKSQLIRIYAQRVFRSIFDKHEGGASPQHQITITLVEALELFHETSLPSLALTNRQRRVEEAQIRNELDMTVSASCDGGPLASLLALIRLLFLSQSSAPQEGDAASSHDLLLLVSRLLTVFAALPDDHPDFMLCFHRSVIR